MRVLEGKVVAQGIRVGIVAARFNEFITSKLVGGALDGLKRHDVKEEDIDAEINKTLDRYSRMVTMDKAAENDDIVVMDFEAIMIMCAVRFPRGLPMFP